MQLNYLRVWLIRQCLQYTVPLEHTQINPQGRGLLSCHVLQAGVSQYTVAHSTMLHAITKQNNVRLYVKAVLQIKQARMERGVCLFNNKLANTHENRCRCDVP